MEATVNEITVNGLDYVRKTDTYVPPNDDIQIVILQRGWVMVGRFHQDGENCTLDNAHVIRSWGTKKGLGELALTGPTAATVLDLTGHVEFHVLTIVARIATEEKLWKLS